MIIVNLEKLNNNLFRQARSRSGVSLPLLYLVADKQNLSRKLRAITGGASAKSVVRYLNGKSRVELGNNSLVVCGIYLRFEYVHEFQFTIVR